ncbi:UDP-N-acetylmuramate: L-alanyl-gamma-D-glutamyl-meso-diaminopimelate ligase [Balneicella halophila]|uniref:UDP-N-acetylmuramate: L-alanyl-gamma-D-glutamyl-meso-diaminopimelate ligase n=1 Tax=Balneicella halophila TaxID=1537566 RepID=A0A7L4URE5_BALHA|nr:Mur ligase family protein [Balneicella halophila]PVX52011.1 UDP-N-acetylmuramate: L-alanyl-gamma-D-glutamyl-meso-diaminopimelate ligase [Balneicella halophila]
MRVHFISIGGAVMHNLAIALSNKGYQVTGSDDEIYDPSKSRLEAKGLLPESWGWFPEKITADLDAVIVGMHARIDNPEIAKAKELNIPIYSFPEYVYEQSKDKKRVVVGGSHGKTTTTSMIMHVLKEQGVNFDYLVGAQLEGFDLMVRLSDAAEIIVIEGDEYPSSPLDRRPKFHWYHPDIAIITGIAWDHINVFPTLDMYEELFADFIKMIKPGGKLFYCSEDSVLKEMAEKATHIDVKAYEAHPNKVTPEDTRLLHDDKETPLKVFGTHNMQNIQVAYYVCKELGISDNDFYKSMESFGGASKRLQLLEKNNKVTVFQDFAHSPSKLKATTSAVKEQYNDKHLVACMELHTFSSLSAKFLSHYKDTMEKADTAIVYFNPHTIEHKRLEPISIEQVKESFGREDLLVYNDSQELQSLLKGMSWDNKVLLLMSSGNFDGISLKEFAKEIRELTE